MFVFYDYETTGTSPTFDQPTQFAAILTDDNFNEIERVNLRCRRSAHILPAPWALAVTGVTPVMLEDPSLTSWFEFAQDVADLIKKWAPATHIGYNTIKFDEEVHRQSFYQNLQPNYYLTQFDGNDRLDLMKVIYGVYAKAPETLVWPKSSDGKTVFKLDRVAPENGFTDHNAHDALGDVEATIFLAALIKDRAPELWNECLRNRSKNEVNQLLETGQALQLVERFGAGEPRIYIGAFVGRSSDNPNTVGFLDLEEADPVELSFFDEAAFAAKVFASPKLVRSITVNKVPSLFKNPDLSARARQRAAYVAGSQEFQRKVATALDGRYADRDEKDLELEQLIYVGGFYSAADKALLAEFHAGDWKIRTELAGKFADKRLQRLSQRLIHAYAPNLSSSSYHKAAVEAVCARWTSTDPKRRWMTFSEVEKQLNEIERQGVLRTNELRDLKRYFSELEALGPFAVQQ